MGDHEEDLRGLFWRGTPVTELTTEQLRDVIAYLVKRERAANECIAQVLALAEKRARGWYNTPPLQWR